MNPARIVPVGPQPIHRTIESFQLFFGVVPVLLCQAVRYTQMGEHAGNPQVFQLIEPGQSPEILYRDTQAVHPGIQGQVDLDRDARVVQRPPVGFIHDGLGQMPAGQHRSHLW